MIENYAQAAEVARPIGAAMWADDKRPGEYYIDPAGYETDDAFIVVDGAREYLVDHDQKFRVMDKPVLIVEKATGLVALAGGLEASELLDEAREVSS